MTEQTALAREIARSPKTHRAALDCSAARKQMDLARARGNWDMYEKWSDDMRTASIRFHCAKEEERSALQLIDYC